jgi:penicillin-binding protein 1C
VPESVGVAAICWPLGQPMNRQDPNCRRQRFAWTLDNTTPPTLQAADQPLGLGLRDTVWVNDQGLRVDAGCPGAKARDIALWPAPLEPWLPRVEQRAARLPAVDPSCPPQAASAPPLSIVGVRPGDNLRRPASNSEPLQVRVSALGGGGQRWWFMNGQPLGETRGRTACWCVSNRPGASSSVRWTKAAKPRGWSSRSASDQRAAGG